jgi:hypothetical protein
MQGYFTHYIYLIKHGKRYQWNSLEGSQNMKVRMSFLWSLVDSQNMHFFVEFKVHIQKLSVHEGHSYTSGSS